jgi:nitrogen regulatory protein PII
MKFSHEMVVCIVNDGFSESVMAVARKVGARGGTVVNAKGTANTEAEKFFNITVQPEKEIVMIVVPSAIKNELMTALYKEVGLDSPGQGIAFSLPIDKAVGLASPTEEKGETPVQEK